jgi:hypothetical protein
MRRPFAVAALLVCMQSSLYAQTLSQRFRELFTFGSCGQPLCLEVGGEHGLHFIPSVTQGEHDLFAFLTGSVANTLASLPFVSATSGVTFRLVNGQMVATSSSAGAIFAERAQTLGRGRLLSGVNVNQLDMRKLRGVPTHDLVFRFAHQNVGAAAMGDPVFENDVIEVSTRLDFNLVVTSIYASYGVHDNIDVGLLVPVVNVRLAGVSEARVLTFATPTPHVFGTTANPAAFADAVTDGSALGVGDVAVRVKAHLGQTQGFGFGVAGDIRLPTGDSANFLGSGQTSARVIGIVSGRIGNFGPHLNAGFNYRSGANQTSSIVGAIGFDHLIADRVTFVGDILADLQTGDSKLLLPDPVVFNSPAPARRMHLTNIPDDEQDNLVDASIGFKIQFPREYRLVTNLLVPLSDGGLRARYLWTLGFERSF